MLNGTPMFYYDINHYDHSFYQYLDIKNIGAKIKIRKGRSIMKEKELLEKGYRKYEWSDIDVFFNTEICQHSGVCVKGVPSVFNVNKKPWINLEEANVIEVMKIIDKCPRQALKYIRKYRVSKTPGKYFIEWDSKMIAEMTYSVAGKTMIIIDHTYVNDDFRGEGLGKIMVNQAVEDARKSGIKIVPLCSFAKSFFEKNNNAQDVLK